MTEWRDIASAPKDGTVLDLRRVVDGKELFTGLGSWREVKFPEIRPLKVYEQYPHLGVSVVEPAYADVGWMRDGVGKRFPEPTHWRPTVME